MGIPSITFALAPLCFAPPQAAPDPTPVRFDLALPVLDVDLDTGEVRVLDDDEARLMLCAP